MAVQLRVSHSVNRTNLANLDSSSYIYYSTPGVGQYGELFSSPVVYCLSLQSGQYRFCPCCAMEMEEYGSLPFLDTRTPRNGDGKLDITVYHRQTHTDR